MEIDNPRQEIRAVCQLCGFTFTPDHVVVKNPNCDHIYHLGCLRGLTQNTDFRGNIVEPEIYCQHRDCNARLTYSEQHPLSFRFGVIDLPAGNDDNHEYQQRIRVLETHVQHLTDELAGRDQQIANLGGIIANARNENAAMGEDISIYQQRITDIQVQLEALSTRLNDHDLRRTQLDNAQREIARLTEENIAMNQIRGANRRLEEEVDTARRTIDELNGEMERQVDERVNERLREMARRLQGPISQRHVPEPNWRLNDDPPAAVPVLVEPNLGEAAPITSRRDPRLNRQINVDIGNGFAVVLPLVNVNDRQFPNANAERPYQVARRGTSRRHHDHSAEQQPVVLGREDLRRIGGINRENDAARMAIENGHHENIDQNNDDNGQFDDAESTDSDVMIIGEEPMSDDDVVEVPINGDNNPHLVISNVVSHAPVHQIDRNLAMEESNQPPTNEPHNQPAAGIENVNNENVAADEPIDEGIGEIGGNEENAENGEAAGEPLQIQPVDHVENIGNIHPAVVARANDRVAVIGNDHMWRGWNLRNFRIDDDYPMERITDIRPIPRYEAFDGHLYQYGVFPNRMTNNTDILHRRGFFFTTPLNREEARYYEFDRQIDYVSIFKTISKKTDEEIFCLFINNWMVIGDGVAHSVAGEPLRHDTYLKAKWDSSEVGGAFLSDQRCLFNLITHITFIPEYLLVSFGGHNIMKPDETEASIRGHTIDVLRRLLGPNTRQIFIIPTPIAPRRTVREELTRRLNYRQWLRRGPARELNTHLIRYIHELEPVIDRMEPYRTDRPGNLFVHPFINYDVIQFLTPFLHGQPLPQPEIDPNNDEDQLHSDEDEN